MDLDRAFELLEQAREDREFLILTLTLNPGIAPLREDPRFDALMRRIGIRP